MNDKILELIRNTALFRKNYYAFVSLRIQDLDISGPEFSYLRELVNNDGISHEVIVKNVCVDKAAATRVAQSLEKKNIILKVKNETDKRGFNIFLTEEGKKLAPKINEILNEWYSTICSYEGEASIETLNSILTKVNNNK